MQTPTHDPRAAEPVTGSHRDPPFAETHTADGTSADGAVPSLPGYEVLGELGRGGMGVVYLARQTPLNRRVAIKLLPNPSAASAARLVRFRQEAEAVARLQHPNITQIFEVGVHAGSSYLVLEYVDGGTLHAKTAGVPQPPRDAARLIETVARAVHHAHERRVVHRDLKPHNILLTAGGVPKVADFGLARSLDADSDLTKTTDFVGTPAYSAPEQVFNQSEQIGPATDVYALGAVLYELLTGRVPFLADTVPALLRLVTDADPTPVRRLRPDCPRDLETIAAKCLAKEPDKRYPTAAALADDLSRFLADEPIHARPVGQFERAARWAKRYPAVAGLLSFVFLLLSVVAVGGVALSVQLDQALRQAKQDRDKATAADQARREQEQKNADTWQTLIERAGMDVNSGRVGQRVKGLEAVRTAAAIRPTDDLRRLATRALALPDFELVQEWDGWRADTARIAFAADFQRFVRMDADGNLEVCRRTDRGEEVLKRLPTLGGPSSTPIYLSPDGRFLAYSPGRWDTYEGRTLWVRDLDAADGRAVVRDEPCHYLHGIMFHPRGTELAVSGLDNTVRRYALPDGRPLEPWRLAVPAGYIAYDPAGERLAAACGDVIPMLDLRPARPRPYTLRLPRIGGWIGWRPDGRVLVHGQAVGPLREIDPADGTEDSRPWEGGSSDNNTPRYTPSGDRAVSTTDDWRTTFLWDAHTGRRLLTLDEPQVTADRPPTADAAMVTRVGGKLRLWRLHPGDEFRTLVRRRAAADEGYSAAGTDQSGRLLAAFAHTAGEFVLFDLHTGDQLAAGGLAAGSFQGFPNHVVPDRGWTLATTDGVYDWPTVWPAGSGEPVTVGPIRRRIATPIGHPLGTGTSRDGSVVAVPNSDHALIFHRDRPTAPLRTGPQADVQNAAVSPDGSVVVTATNRTDGRTPTVRVWDARTAELVKDLTAAPSGGHTARFSPDGSWIALQFTGHWAVWDARSWRPVRDIPNAESVIFSHDGRLYAFDTGGLIRLCETATGRTVAELPGMGGRVFRPVAFTPDGTRLIVEPATRTALHVWDLRKLRAGLAAVGLDWDWPAFLPEAGPTGPVRVRTDLADRRERTAAWGGAEELAPLFNLNPTTAAQRAARGTALSRLGWFDLALRDFDAAVELDPAHAPARLARGHEFFRRGRWADAVGEYDAAIARQPKLAPALFRRAWARVELEQHEAAVASFTELLATPWVSAEDRPGLLVLRAAVRERTGDADGAAEDRETAAALPNAAGKLNDFAWRLLTNPPETRVPAAALILSRQSLALRPDDHVHRNTLGLAEYRNGLYQDAIADLERSLAAGGGRYDGYDLFILSMCHARRGDRATAADCYARAVRWLDGIPPLTPREAAELRVFRAEAATELNK